MSLIIIIIINSRYIWPILINASVINADTGEVTKNLVHWMSTERGKASRILALVLRLICLYLYFLL